MLVLSRKAGEGLQIGDEVHLVVLTVEKSRVRLGVEAPRGVHIKRDELPPLPDDASNCHEPKSA